MQPLPPRSAAAIGDSAAEVGSLVTKNSAQPLTTIVPLDPIWVRFKVSESDYLNSVNNAGSGDLRHSPLELVLADNSVFPFKGHVQNSANQVDPKTGTLELQATFANPQHVLLPGQFGRIRVRVREQEDALVIPQKAVEELQGLANRSHRRSGQQSGSPQCRFGRSRRNRFDR